MEMMTRKYVFHYVSMSKIDDVLQSPLLFFIVVNVVLGSLQSFVNNTSLYFHVVVRMISRLMGPQKPGDIHLLHRGFQGDVFEGEADRRGPGASRTLCCLVLQLGMKMVLSIVMEVANNGWFISWKIHEQKWMMTGDTPMT